MIRRLLKCILRRARFAKPMLEKISKLECSISSRWVSNAHRRLFLIQYLIPPTPEYFDHRIDLYYQWLASRNPLWVERGVFNSLALRGGEVLELCCGDGFYTRNFYSVRAKKIIACDFDKKAIMTAIRENSAENIEYILCDIRYDMPTGKFDNIIMDGIVGRYFTKDEMQNILKNIKARLSDSGIFSGYIVAEKQSDQKFLEYNKCEFKSKEDVIEILKPYFNNIIVFETIYPERHNLYFWASDGVIPFKEGWENMISFSREVSIYEKK